eukprot:sb/3467501/
MSVLCVGMVIVSLFSLSLSLSLYINHFTLTLLSIQEKLKPICDRWKAICTEAQVSLKTLCTARDKEAKAVRTLEKTKCKEGSKKAEQVAADLAEKQTELARKTGEITGLMQQFHSQKLGDLKLLLSTYSHIQMLSHARALEFYTRSYQDMVDINLEEYVETIMNETMPLSISQSTPALATPNQSIDQLNVTNLLCGKSPRANKSTPRLELIYCFHTATRPFGMRYNPLVCDAAPHRKWPVAYANSTGKLVYINDYFTFTFTFTNPNPNPSPTPTRALTLKNLFQHRASAQTPRF